MTDVTLTGLTPAQIATLGDAALKAGHLALAEGLYRTLVRLAPRAPNAHARLGLTRNRTQRSPTMLDVLTTVEAIPNAAPFVGEGIATWLKTPPFISDERFMALMDENVEIVTRGNQNWHWNLSIVLSAAQQAKGVPGDFVELGVYKGHTSKFVADYVEFGRWDRRWWLFDTFEGVPSDQADRGREQSLSASVYGPPYSFEEVRDRFAAFGNFVVTRGRVPEVFAEVIPERVAFLHIDLNNATAEVAALDALYERISPGGVIVFDDFIWSSSQAQHQAESAWFAARGLTVYALPTGQGLFIKPPA